MFQKIAAFFKKELMLSVALIAALASLFITPPSLALLQNIDWKTLATLFMLLSVLEGFKKENIFQPLLQRTGKLSTMLGLSFFFVFSVFFSSMFVTNDVSLIIFVPLRALTVGVTKLVPADEVVEQVSLFEAPRSTREKQEKLEVLVDQLREKHGEASITLGYQGNKGIGVIRGEGKR